EFGKEMLINEFGYIYQDFKLIDNLTVYQNILLGQELATTGIDYDYLIEIADELGITDILDHKVYSLSGGQMQRVAIARAIVRRPKVIFADEPTGNLDSYNSINVYNILRDLADDILVVIVTHDTEITKWADRVITLEDGKVVSDNPNIPNFEEKELSTEEVREEDDIQEILLKQKAIKGKKINAFFSYKKQPKATQNVARLSGKSSLGLSISLLNKDVVKKIFLTIVMVLLIALMTLSTSMSFATTEKTMANAINMSAKGKKIFGLEVFVENIQKSITLKDISEMDRLLEENNLNFYKVGTGEVIADSWKNMQIAKSEAVDTAYYINMNVANIENAIFVDNPTEIGVDIILGKAPASQNEIAISKSYYDYLLHYKKFKVNVREIDYEITFDKDIVGKTITPFNIVISGVFDDKNAIDEKWKTKTIDSLNATQNENL
ncbi:MAG: ATP-binding cassette domain-containing protein, partial [Clostridia bacterium]|nr:ATP-binding cassette domain-containing protein [Clostridia bacterium]